MTNELIEQLTEAKNGLIEAAKTGNKIMADVYRKQIRQITRKMRG